MGRWWLGVVAVVVLASPGNVVGCRGGCGELDCGGGLNLWWSPGDVPEAVGARLCVDGRCDEVEPHPIGDAGQFLSVTPRAATGDHVAVELELLDRRGARVGWFRGEGAKTGRCCPAVSILAAADGRLVVAEPF